MITQREGSDDDEEERLAKKQQKDRENEKLWQKLQIDFRLEAFRFPDNKIYGTININPESSRRLIKTLVLVVNKTNRIEFDPHYQHLSASGINTNRRNPSAYIEAIPHKRKYLPEKKTSKICYFFFTGEVFALNPTISFDWSGEQAKLVINWYHIGDKYAQKYILYLDGMEVQYIRQKLIDDAFDVRIEGFEAAEKHTFQLAGRLNNGREAYRSDLFEFIVPDKRQNDEGGIEFISVANERAPPNLPAYMPMKGEKIEEDFNPNEKELERTKQSKRNRHSKISACCNHCPHETFPGIEHYLNNINHSSSSSSSESGIDDDDDDDDVIIAND